MPQSTRKSLRAKLEERRGLLVPGAANALAARIIEDLDFEAVYVSGAGVTNAFWGLPDLAFLSLTEIAQHTAAIRDAVDIPIIVDADTGFGNALNVRHAVRALERAGANAIQIEDQTSPKKCGHFEQKSVISAEEMAGKVKAAVDARMSEDLLIVARTDALAVEGFDAAIERAERYIEAGANVTFVEAPESGEEIRKIPQQLRVPQVVNIVVGGKTPVFGREELAGMGYGLVLYANVALQGAIAGMQRALQQLKTVGRMDAGSEIVASFAERQRLVKKSLFEDLERKYSGGKVNFAPPMQIHHVKVYPSSAQLAREEQLAWKLACVAADEAPIEPEVTQAVIDRIIDDAAVAVAAINRGPVVAAREMALGHPRPVGATVFGLSAEQRFSPEWAAWANGTAVRELDMHDTFLAADYSHPGDTIPPILAVAQAMEKSGRDLIRGIACAYEIQIDLVKSICLHKHRIDHIAHLCPAQAAGIGAMLGLPADTIYQAVQQAAHVSFTTRQSRKGAIGSWKAFAPAHAGKLAIEAVDRAMRGEDSPSPIYEGEDGVIAWMLDGPAAQYEIMLPAGSEPKRAILESFTKEHSAEYQAQALIDLAFRMRRQIADFASIERIVIHTSHHTHTVIGTGATDPQKFDPNASRETLDHSVMYIFAVALQDGKWHHIDSYTRERANRPDTVHLWRKIETREDAEWTRRYHETDPGAKAFGGRVEIFFRDGSRIEDELAVANAHPFGEKPFRRADYIRKFETLTGELLPARESRRFLDLVQQLPSLAPEDLPRLNIELPKPTLARGRPGIF